MQYHKITVEDVKELSTFIGAANVLVEDEKMDMYSRDEVSDKSWEKYPEAVVKPETTEQVSKIVKWANEKVVPIIARGGGTGLAAGAVPLQGGIVLSLEKMNKIIEIDTENLFMVLEPGISTGDVQRTAKEHGLFYAGDPCSAESSFIGGNVATNAGGNRAVKYGTTSRHVYGLEMVMPNGEIVTFGGKNVKDVSGYDVIHLFVGSEGTLGVITKIWLKLMPLPKYIATLLVPFKEMQDAINVVPKIMTAGIIPTCLEFMDSESIKASELYLNIKLPYSEAGAYIICQVDGTTEQQVESEYESIGKICLANNAMEVFVSDNMASEERIWKSRKAYAEALRMISPVYCIEDIVVPISNIPKALEQIDKIAKKNHCRIPSCGHAGDGNIHCTLLREDRDEHTWHELKDNVLSEIYAIVYELGGNLTGEHGVGAKRVEALAKHMTAGQYSVLKSIKTALDPKNIMNPGKVLPL
jgi:glycolate oxidase